MLLDVKDSLLVLVDLQGSLMDKVIETERVVAVAKKLVSVARELEVPIVVTEHYPEGLQPTIPEVVEHLGDDYRPLLKRIFSCWGADNFRQAIEESGRRTVVLAGIETHICVQQTALECVDAGYKVFVLADGVGARISAT